MPSAAMARRRAIRAEKGRFGLQSGRNDPQRGRIEKAVYGALIRHSTMLSTSVNPTDGLRFDGDAEEQR